MKTNRIYIIIILAWIALIAVFYDDLVQPVYAAFKDNPQTFFTVLLATLFVAYFWLNGLKDVVYTIFFHTAYQPPILPPYDNGETPTVELVYCTHNDFTHDSLISSMTQRYSNYKTIILDDSTSAEKIAEIDLFAERYKLQVIRRDNHDGHKAGNLNNYLKNSSAEFFVVLDSDEIIPPDFITKALPYFSNPKVAVVQGNHIATDNQNSFMAAFADGVESHWHTYQKVKDSFGFLSFLGHGAMIRTSIYKEVGGFPNLVAEDLCFSIEARNAGYFVKFAPEIICFEQYPINYLAFKKRHAKWTMGNMEFIKSYTWKLITSKMHWYEKLDIVLFTYSLPLSVFFAIYLLINIVIFPILHFDPHYKIEMLAPTIVFLFAPMLNDLIYYFSRKSLLKLILYALGMILLYGSMFYISFKSSFRALFGKAEFIITPKEHEHINFWRAVWLNKGELVFSTLLMAVSLYFLHSIMPVFLISLPSLGSVYLTRMGNRKV
jgi:cellulose synthase/poly-beta-1,6-N-acetylglucosamine synthase-like glycosyltransferase